MGFGPFFVFVADFPQLRQGMPNSLMNLVQPTVAGLGYELVDTQVSNRGRHLRFFIDKDGGVTLDDCADVSRHLSRVLEVEGVDYDRLEISSPGLDRPLRTEAEFRRFAGQRVDVRMRLPDETGRRRFVGQLRGAQDGTVTVDVDGQAVNLDLNSVDRARLVPQF